MSLKLYAHPFSSYCQKVTAALYENAIPFDLRLLGPDEPENSAEFARLSPMGKMPLLVDGDRPVFESSVIIEYIQLRHPGPVHLIPDEPEAALRVRLLDRFFDAYVMTPLQAIVFDALRPKEDRCPAIVRHARATLDAACYWLEGELAGRDWVAGDAFTLADCAAAPALFYADWVHPLAGRFPVVEACRARLLARPSFARAVEEARPYRHLFPLGAPDLD